MPVYLKTPAPCPPPRGRNSPTPCGWKQAQTTGGGLLLDEVEDDFQFKGCPGLYFVGETLDCAGSCGGYNLHWAFGSGIIAGRAAAKLRKKKK